MELREHEREPMMTKVNEPLQTWYPMGCVANRHTLMVGFTTTGNLWDRFVKRRRQTAMYNHYGPWRGHDSAFMNSSHLADAQKKGMLLSEGRQLRGGGREGSRLLELGVVVGRFRGSKCFCFALMWHS